MGEKVLNQETKEILEQQGAVASLIRKEIEEKGKKQSEKLEKITKKGGIQPLEASFLLDTPLPKTLENPA